MITRVGMPYEIELGANNGLKIKDAIRDTLHINPDDASEVLKNADNLLQVPGVGSYTQHKILEMAQTIREVQSVGIKTDEATSPHVPEIEAVSPPPEKVETNKGRPSKIEIEKDPNACYKCHATLEEATETCPNCGTEEKPTVIYRCTMCNGVIGYVGMDNEPKICLHCGKKTSLKGRSKTRSK